MTDSPDSILLLSSEEDVIKDATYSLNLINVPLSVARTMLDAELMLQRTLPRLIICRLHLKTQEKAGLLFARSVSEDSRLCFIPRVLLAKKPELNSVKTESGYFFAQLLLPIVFPVFTQQVQAILSQLTVQAHYKEERAEVRFDPQRDPNYKFKLVEDIHRKVVELIKQSEVFRSAMPQDVPTVVAHITNEVCTNFDVKSR